MSFCSQAVLIVTDAFQRGSYARLVSEWIASIGLDAKRFSTHSLGRTKATLIYRRTGNLRAVRLLLGHPKIESSVRYLGVEVDDAQTQILLKHKICLTM